MIGSFADGINLTFGTNTGPRSARRANQKLAFFGKPPIVQPTLGAASAGSSYTSNEQTMLQRRLQRRSQPRPGVVNCCQFLERFTLRVTGVAQAELYATHGYTAVVKATSLTSFWVFNQELQ